MHFNNDSEHYKIIGLNIKRCRESEKLTQMQLAERSQISISYLSKIEASGCDNNVTKLRLIKRLLYYSKIV